MIDGHIRPMVSSDLEIVLSWRNHEQVRRYMFARHLISKDEHEVWYSKANGDPQQHLLIYEVDGKRRGFARFRLMDAMQIAQWGFYSAPKAERGIGRGLGRSALDYAFERLGLHRVQGEVIEYNSASVRLHEKLGFIREGFLRDQFYDGRNYHGVICFGLLKSEWEKMRAED